MSKPLNPLEEEIQRLRTETAQVEEKKEDVSKETEQAQEENQETVSEVVEQKTEESATSATDEIRPDAAAMARMRREKAEAERKVRELEDELKKKAQPIAQENQDPEPNKSEDYEKWLEWELRQAKKQIGEAVSTAKEVKESFEQRQRREEFENLQHAALNQLVGIENEYKKKAPDYDDASEHLKNRLIESYSLINPSASKEQVQAAANKYVFDLGVNAYQQGYNPADYLYNMAKTKFGYAPKQPEPEKEKPKLDLKKVEENKRRSSSGSAAGGQGGSQSIGIDDIGTLTMAQFSRLTPAQREELKAQSRR